MIRVPFLRLVGQYLGTHFACNTMFLYIGDCKWDFVKSKALLKFEPSHAIMPLDKLEFEGGGCLYG